METDKTLPTGDVPPQKWRLLMRNPISLAGVALSIVALANIFLFSLIDQIATKPGPYIGILAYMVSPAFLVLGLLIITAAPQANFQHPVDIGDLTQVNCADCHTGGNSP